MLRYRLHCDILLSTCRQNDLTQHNLVYFPNIRFCECQHSHLFNCCINNRCFQCFVRWINLTWLDLNVESVKLKISYVVIVGPGTDLVPLLIFFLFFFVFLLLGQPLQSSKRLRLRHFKPYRDEIWQDCSPSKYASIDVGFSIWRHSFRMAAWHHFTQNSAAISDMQRLPNS